MVIGIIFGAYQKITDMIAEAEELEVAPTMIREFLLLRQPSLVELDSPLSECLMNEYGRGGVLRRFKATPKNEKGQEISNKDTFSDDHLLNLFDPTNDYRKYGVLPLIKVQIKHVKVQRDAAASKIGRMARASMLRWIAAAKKNGAMDTRAHKVIQAIKSNVETKEIVHDDLAMDRHEFCDLLHYLDETGRGAFEVADEDEQLIADVIIRVYGRQGALAKKLSTRRHLESIQEGVLKQQSQLDESTAKIEDIYQSQLEERAALKEILKKVSPEYNFQSTPRTRDKTPARRNKTPARTQRTPSALRARPQYP